MESIDPRRRLLQLAEDRSVSLASLSGINWA